MTISPKMQALLRELGSVDGTQLPVHDPTLEIARTMARQGFIRLTDEADGWVGIELTDAGRALLKREAKADFDPLMLVC
jgi:hypothetical protein